MFKLAKLGCDHCTGMRFASLLSGGFTTMAVINPPEKKQANRTSVHCIGYLLAGTPRPKTVGFCDLVGNGK